MLVNSWDCKGNVPADEWFNMAHAYIEASELLFREMKTGRFSKTFCHGKTAIFLFEQSLEHFLKAGIICAGKQPRRTHNLTTLWESFQKLYPRKDYEWSGRIDEAIQTIPEQPPLEFSRYPNNRSGKDWLGNWSLDPDLWHEQVTAFRSDYNKLQSAISKTD